MQRYKIDRIIIILIMIINYCNRHVLTIKHCWSRHFGIDRREIDIRNAKNLRNHSIRACFVVLCVYGTACTLYHNNFLFIWVLLIAVRKRRLKALYAYSDAHFGDDLLIYFHYVLCFMSALVLFTPHTSISIHTPTRGNDRCVHVSLFPQMNRSMIKDSGAHSVIAIQPLTIIDPTT